MTTTNPTCRRHATWATDDMEDCTCPTAAELRTRELIGLLRDLGVPDAELLAPRRWNNDSSMGWTLPKGVSCPDWFQVRAALAPLGYTMAIESLRPAPDTRPLFNIGWDKIGQVSR